MTKYDNSQAGQWSLATRAIHAGQPVDEQTKSRNLPIYNSSAFVFDSAAHAAARFDLSDAGPIYTRLTNPTSDAVEQRLASLEGGVAAVLFASGMAAETAIVLNLAQAGDHIVASARLYGGTSTLLEHTLARVGITTTFVEDADDPEAWQAAVQPNTKAFFAESIANPQCDLLDIPMVAEVAHRNQVPFIVDNTVATPALLRPLEHGADIIISSATKYLTGNGSALAGVVVDGGTFDWTVQRDGEDVFPNFTVPDPAYHGLRYADLGAPAFALRLRAGVLRDTGAAAAPFNAWTLAQGLDTLALRIERHNANAQAVAEYLEARDGVAKVSYAGLKSSPWHHLQEKLGIKGAGAVIAFDLADAGRDEAWAFIDALKLHSNVANIGDVRSLVVHPASTTHSQVDEAGQASAGISQATIRLAVGIEDVEDIIADLEQAFVAIGK